MIYRDPLSPHNSRRGAAVLSNFKTAEGPSGAVRRTPRPVGGGGIYIYIYVSSGPLARGDAEQLELARPRPPKLALAPRAADLLGPRAHIRGEQLEVEQVRAQDSLPPTLPPARPRTSGRPPATYPPHPPASAGGLAACLLAGALLACGTVSAATPPSTVCTSWSGTDTSWSHLVRVRVRARARARLRVRVS